MEEKEEEFVVRTSRARGEVITETLFLWVTVVPVCVLIFRNITFVENLIWWRWFAKSFFKWFALIGGAHLAIWNSISTVCILLTGIKIRPAGVQLTNPAGAWATVEYKEIRHCSTSNYKGDGDFEHEVFLSLRLCPRGWKPPVAAPVHGIVSSMFGGSLDWVHVKPDWENAIPFLKTLKAHDVELRPEELDEDIEAVLEAEENEGSGSA